MGAKMVHGASIRRWEQYSVLGVVLVLHAVGLAFLMLRNGPGSTPALELGALKVIAVAAIPPAPTPPSTPPLPSKFVQQPLPELKLALSAAASVPATAAAEGCLALEQVRNSVAADPNALASALDAPPETKSIAGAVLLWNGDWIQAASTVEAPLAPARRAIERSVAAMSQECLDEQIVGPRLVPFPVGTGTMFLVFGSGDWSWRDVANDAFFDTAAPEERPQPSLSARFQELLGRVNRN